MMFQTTHGCMLGLMLHCPAELCTGRNKVCLPLTDFRMHLVSATSCNLSDCRGAVDGKLLVDA